MRWLKKNKAKIVIIVLVVCIFGIYVLIVSLRKPPEQAQIVPPVKIVSPVLGTAVQTIKLTGFVANDTTVTVFPKVAGTLLKLQIKTGDFVYSGQILGKIDNEPYAFQLNQAKAGYTATSAAWERVKNLYAAGSISQQVYDRTKAEFEASRAQYDLAKLQFAYTEIRSPVRGTVLKIHTDEGNMAVQAQPIVTIGSSEAVKINLAVPERYFTLFEQTLDPDDSGLYAEIPVLANKRFQAHIQTVSPYILPQTRTFDVECTLLNAGEVRSGMFARVYITTAAEENVYVLPYSTLTGGNSLWYIEENRAKKLAYSPNFEGDSGFVVPETFAPLQFITEGQHFLKDGDPVRIIGENDENS